MSAKVLLAEFERLAEVPHSSNKLRDLVQKLAVRGKLIKVSGGGNDASAVVEGIYRAREKLVQEGVISQKRRGRPVVSSTLPFRVPRHWGAIPLGHALHLTNGRAFKPTEWTKDGLPIIRIQNLNNAQAPFNQCNHDVPERFHVRNGDFLISWSGTPGTSFGAHIWSQGHALLNQHIFKAQIIGGGLTPKFLRLAINARLIELIDQAHGGVGLRHITKGKLEQLLLTVPPVSEQDRIVAKVDELMALLDRLEAAQAERERRRERLASSWLRGLVGTRGQLPDVGSTFSIVTKVTTRPELISEFRQGVLALAVAGRLSTQKTGDESADEFLLRLRGDKNRDVGKGSRGLRGNDAVGKKKPPSLAIPRGWAWARLGDLAGLITSGSRDWAKHYSSEGAIYVRMGNLSKGSYHLRLDNIQRVRPPSGGEGTRTRLEEGDILISITGEVGWLGRVPAGFGEAYINQHTCLVRPLKEVGGRYIPEFLRSPLAKRQFNAPQRGIKNSFRLSDVSQLWIPVPPLDEQARIVGIIDDLMKAADVLESKVTRGQAVSTRLLEVALRGALEEVA